MELFSRQTLPPEEVSRMNPLKMAYIGDTVWDLMVRSSLMDTDYKVHRLHQMAIAQVNATAQSRAAEKLMPLLTQQESDIFRRGRNAHARHNAPKNQDPACYRTATGLEALMGFLYLTGQDERLKELFQISCREEDDRAQD